MPTKQKNKTLGKKLFVGLFVGCLCVAFPVFNVFSRQLSMDNHENRLLTTLPDILSAPLSELPTQLDSFLVDNSPFRYQLVLLNAEIDYRLFGISESDQVVLGEDGWMFYKDGPNAATPLANYQGLARCDEETLRALAENLQTCADQLAANGGQLVLNLTPGKDRMCAEYVPDCYPVMDEQTMGMQVVDHLREHTDVPVVYSYDALREYCQNGELPAFFKTDTHWNHLGALLALDPVLDEFGLETPDFEEYEFAQFTTQAGDMANVTALYRIFDEEPDYRPTTYEFEPDERTLAVVGDSFSQYYMDYLSARFDTCWREDLTGATRATITDCGAQLVILEANERSIENLCQVLAQ